MICLRSTISLTAVTTGMTGEREIIMKICNERVTDMMGILQTVIRELNMKIYPRSTNEDRQPETVESLHKNVDMLRCIKLTAVREHFISGD